MKYILITTLLLSCLFSQAQVRLVEISKEYVRKEVPLSDNLTYKWRIGTQNDTARYFNPGADQYEATVTFRKIGGIPPVDVTEDVDDRDSRIVYGTGWDKTCCTSDPNSPHFNSTISWSCAADNSFKFTFTGKSVTWFAEKLNTHGIAGVKFDQDAEVKVDLYNATKLTKQAIFTKNFSVNGPHSVTIRVTGEKNVNSSNVCVVSDSFRIIK